MKKGGDVRIRRADPVEDRDRVLAVLGRNIPEAASPARHDWLYLSNPLGHSLVWLAEDAETDTAVGTSSAHPRRMHLRGRVVTALVLSDFAVDSAYRSLGPALRLQRATLAPVREGEFEFCYDYPSESMLAIYRRMGAVEVAKIRRFVRLLRITPSLRRRWGAGIRSTVAGRIGDLALRARDELRGKPRGLEVELLAGTCGQEFDSLDERVRERFPVQSARSAAHLCWRYLQHGTARHELLCARRAGELLGFAAFRETEHDVLALVDLYAVAEDAVPRALLAGLLSIARSRDVAAVWAQTMEGSPAARMLAGLGFAARELGAGQVVYAPGLEEGPLLDAECWWTLEGDRDA